MMAVTLRGEELEIARAEVGAVRDALDEGDYRDVLDDLLGALAERARGRGAARGGARPAAHARTPVRARPGPLRAGGEQAALRAFRKLPTGSELAASAAAVNDALAALDGRPIERLALTAVGPAAFTLAVGTDGAKLTIRLDRQGARVTSVEA